jgi:hypothetical protein
MDRNSRLSLTEEPSSNVKQSTSNLALKAKLDKLVKDDQALFCEKLS